MKNLFILRGAFNGLFSLYLACVFILGMKLPMPSDGFYALLDGLLGLALAATMLRDIRGEWLFPLVLIDALARVAFGVLTFNNPALGTSLGWVLFLALGISTLMALGVVGVLYVFLGKRIWRKTGGGARPLARPALIASIVTLLVGVSLNLDPTSDVAQPLIFCAYTLVFGLTLLLAGLSLSKETDRLVTRT
ncbi:hypothetical protein QTI17_33275 [Variovorax sp. J31P179]|uniref:hypothetical protein n=1 Tax=Variovorax sp. J31P179 TaxID=3053508 RepID=UPI00257632DF|nr:hypothetical protein [Variovorax sp. J31P179]MDM0085474.1 hypothetical protein [Variovorax sp. J31P179]